jgi:hypothetical protein
MTLDTDHDSDTAPPPRRARIGHRGSSGYRFRISVSMKSVHPSGPRGAAGAAAGPAPCLVRRRDETREVCFRSKYTRSTAARTSSFAVVGALAPLHNRVGRRRKGFGAYDDVRIVRMLVEAVRDAPYAGHK